jgi:ABC-type transport system substrate-binding protein
MGIPIIGAPADTPSMNFVDSLVSPVLENVVGEDAAGRFKPILAESADISSDGKTITLHLLKGVKFQDGTDFNAAAVKFNLEKVLAANSAASGILKLVTSYDIVDDNTLRINLSKYDARLLLTLAETANGQIASPTAYQKKAKPEDHMIKLSWSRTWRMALATSPMGRSMICDGTSLARRAISMLSMSG